MKFWSSTSLGKLRMIDSPRLVRFGFAVITACLGLSLQNYLVFPLIRVPFLLLYPAVFLVIVTSGFTSACLAIVICMVGSILLFLEPVPSFWEGVVVPVFVYGFSSFIAAVFSLQNERERKTQAQRIQEQDQIYQRQEKLRLALQQSEERFKTIFNTIPHIVWTASPDGVIDFYNHRWYEFTGMSQDDANKEGVTFLVHPEDRPKMKEAWHRSILMNQLYRLEFRMRDLSENRYRWFLAQAFPICGQDGRVSKWFGTYTDIDEQKNAEAVLQKAGKEFRLITEAIPQAVWRTDPDGKADYFSQRFYDYVGYQAEDLLGWGWAELIHPDDRQRVLDEWQRCRDAGVPVSVDFRIRGAGGNYRWFLSLGNPFRDVRGKIVKYYGTWTDIEDQKHAQSKILASLQARDEFLSIASHELKTPLTSLNLQVQLLKRWIERVDFRSENREKVLYLFKQADQQVFRLGRLVDDMLDISKIRTGKLSLSYEKVDICELVKEAVDRIRLQFVSASKAVPRVHCPGPIIGSWDRLRMEQVITNLLTNAIRYGKGNPIDVKIEQRGTTALIQVEDRGIGIPGHMKEKVFDRFERGVNPSEATGFGLGLYISKQIIQAHQGRIWVESQLGLGSTFYVELPLSSVKHGFGHIEVKKVNP